jgi:hypothetical protein
MEEIGFCEARLEIETMTHLQQSPGSGPAPVASSIAVNVATEALQQWAKVRLCCQQSPMHTRTLQHAFLAGAL